MGGSSNANAYGGVYLGQGILPRHRQIPDTGIGTALDAAPHVIFNFAGRRRDTGCNGPARVRGIGKGKIYAAGHLDVAVVGADADIRAVFRIRIAVCAAGQGIIQQ